MIGVFFIETLTTPALNHFMPEKYKYYNSWTTLSTYTLILNLKNIHLQGHITFWVETGWDDTSSHTIGFTLLHNEALTMLHNDGWRAYSTEVIGLFRQNFVDITNKLTNHVKCFCSSVCIYLPFVVFCYLVSVFYSFHFSFSRY